MQLDGLVSFQVLFAQEDVEVGLLLDRDIDLVGVLWAAAWGRLSSSLSFSAFFHSSGSLLLKLIYIIVWARFV